jgi:hypothetical protein
MQLHCVRISTPIQAEKLPRTCSKTGQSYPHDMAERISSDGDLVHAKSTAILTKQKKGGRLRSPLC